MTPTSGLTTTEAGGTATFTVVLDSQPTANVTIALSSSDTTEATVSPASLTFTPANWNVAQTVTVTGVDDLVDDGHPLEEVAGTMAQLQSAAAQALLASFRTEMARAVEQAVGTELAEREQGHPDAGHATGAA